MSTGLRLLRKVMNRNATEKPSGEQPSLLHSSEEENIKTLVGGVNPIGMVREEAQWKAQWSDLGLTLSLIVHVTWDELVDMMESVSSSLMRGNMRNPDM